MCFVSLPIYIIFYTLMVPIKHKVQRTVVICRYGHACVYVFQVYCMAETLKCLEEVAASRAFQWPERASRRSCVAWPRAVSSQTLQNQPKISSHDEGSRPWEAHTQIYVYIYTIIYSYQWFKAILLFQRYVNLQFDNFTENFVRT